jgi:hypothetical protein
METFALYLSWLVSAWWFGETDFLYERGGFARLAIPTGIAAVGLLFCNAYSDPSKRSPMKPVLHALVSLALAFLCQAAMFDTWRSLAVPFSIMLSGSCIGLVLVSSVRMVFPGPHDHYGLLVVSKQSRPTHLNPLTMRTSFQHIGRRITEAEPSPRHLLLAGALLLAALLSGVLFRHGPAAASALAVFIVVLVVIYQIRMRG